MLHHSEFRPVHFGEKWIWEKLKSQTVNCKDYDDWARCESFRSKLILILLNARELVEGVGGLHFMKRGCGSDP